MILAYWNHAEYYYRHPARTVPLRELYGHTRAADFDALALEAVRDKMIADGRCRKRVNHDLARIKRAFEWIGGRKLAPLSIDHSLQTVEGLRAGRSNARETAPVITAPASRRRTQRHPC